MSKMLKISETYSQQKQKQDIHLCILRSDYMIDTVSD